MGIVRADVHLADITRAIADVNAATAFLAAHKELAAAPATPPTVQPVFEVPADERGQFAAREGVLNNLKTAFAALTRAPGGDLGGLRAKIFSDIATAATDVAADVHILTLERRKAAPTTAAVPAK